MIKTLFIAFIAILLPEGRTAKDLFVYEKNSPQKQNYHGKPFSPDNWDSMDSSDIEDSGQAYDWESVNDYVKYSGNECGKKRKQSPIKIQDGSRCGDDHKMRGGKDSRCNWKNVKFLTTDHGLRADFINCRVQPAVDFSHQPGYYTLVNIEVKTPSEHVTAMKDSRGRTTGYKQYDGELVLKHYGMKNRKGDHRHELLHIAVFLDAGHNADMNYEKYLIRWEAAQYEEYNKCGFEWNRNKCNRRNLGLKGASVNLESDAALKENSDTQYNYVNDTGRVLRTPETFSSFARYGNPAGKTRNRSDRSKPHTDLIPGQYYHKYEGSMTVPPCMDNVHWKVMHEIIEISDEQLQRTENLIAKNLNSDCKRVSVCVRSSTCQIKCNRPIQKTTKYHELKSCTGW